jgi:cardiolipin synthase (CMP-forming)
MRHLPNAITLLRLALVPVIALLLHRGEHGTAFALFVVSALSDFADGQIARRWHVTSRFGAFADPLADKLTMFVVTVLLALQQALPWWFATLLVVRDALIVGGALAYRFIAGTLEMAPTRISKLNTALQFMLLLGVLAVQAGHLEGGSWVDALMWATVATMAVSGTHYVLAWSRRAAKVTRNAA